MSVTDNTIYTFYELAKQYRIQIPIIQRDYAQGRTTNTDVCKNFLNALYDSIKNNQSINLDFIYGNIKDDVFLPLDGQQRLTTLFLLHWYAYQKDNKTEEAKKLLCKFSYETRISSRRFCESLVMHQTDINESSKISDDIINSKWFFLSWKLDPTVHAMLNTIDLIHSIFFQVDELWSALVDNKIITFHLLILEHFGLSDDLYIKMNARGRLLTPFENLKAELQGKIEKNSWEKEKPTIERFANKVDTIWTDFLWSNYRKNNTIDDAHMNFITSLVMYRISISQNYNYSERINLIQKLNENNAVRNLIQYIDKEDFEYICKCYDLYAELVKTNTVPKLDLEMWRHNPDTDLLYQILVGNNTSYTHRVLFYAQTEFYLNNSNRDQDRFLSWMRVVRNIISRADVTAEGKRPDIIRSPENFAGVISLIYELAKGSESIYDFLNTNNVVSSFAREQTNEEKLKANIICMYPDKKQLIFHTEDNQLLRGKITFALKCSGYNGTIESIDFTLLEKVQSVFEKNFNNEELEDFDKLRRAMLTIPLDGKYRFYEYWYSYWYAGEADKYKLFSNFREIEFFIGKDDFSGYFKELVLKLTVLDYDGIIEDFKKPETMENWQFRIIKEEELIKKCNNKYIAIPKDRSFCYLLKGKRPSKLESAEKVE
ncbi:MAG: DUF262 domain-containing protein [Clostridia bacterium]|nr:DUF262 domain-containing protein [Clostridia bacterium]